MVGGILNKLSESTVASTTSISGVLTETVIITGTTAIATINPPVNGGFNGVLFVICPDGAISLTTAGNIALAVTAAQNKVTVLLWSASKGKWYPNV